MFNQDWRSTRRRKLLYVDLRYSCIPSDKDWLKQMPQGAFAEELIQHSWNYKDTVRVTEFTGQIEVTVVCLTDGSACRRVRLRAEEFFLPSYCRYSQNGEGCSCYHEIAARSDKFGSSNIYRYSARRHLYENWKKLYKNVTFTSSCQSDVDNEIYGARIKVLKGENLHILKTIPPLVDDQL